MSMRDYGIDDYGLFLDEDAMKAIAKSLFDDFSEEEWTKDRYAIMDEVYNSIVIVRVSNFTGENPEINDDGTTIWNTGDYFDDDVIFYVTSDRYPELFRAVYKNIGEMIDEFKLAVGKYLPSDFDYRKNVRHITGSFYG